MGEKEIKIRKEREKRFDKENIKETKNNKRVDLKYIRFLKSLNKKILI